MDFQWPGRRSSPCDKAIMLLHVWAESEPAIVALLPRLTRANLDDAMLNLNPTWRIYTDHISRCSRCCRHNANEFRTALIEPKLSN
jgi:hypothetical protein